MGLPLFQITKAATNEIVASQVVEAKGAWASFKGLMFQNPLPSGHGMLFRPVRGIHTDFMRFPIDLVYLDKQNRVTKVREAMGPWRYDFSSAAGVIEMNAGAARASGISPGDTLHLVLLNGA
jgi:uncharacterized membrane protein (UPF0127 family)